MKSKIKKILPFLLFGCLLITAVYFFFYPSSLTRTSSPAVCILEYKLVGGIAGNYDDLKIDKNFVYKYRFREGREQSGKLNLLEASEMNTFLGKYNVIDFSSPDKGSVYDGIFNSLRFQGNNKLGPKNEENYEISNFANRIVHRIKLNPLINNN